MVATVGSFIWGTIALRKSQDVLDGASRKYETDCLQLAHWDFFLVVGYVKSLPFPNVLLLVSLHVHHPSHPSLPKPGAL